MRFMEMMIGMFTVFTLAIEIRASIKISTTLFTLWEKIMFSWKLNKDLAFGSNAANCLGLIKND